MEELKNFFKCSSDSVIITDYDFNILWSNRHEEIFSFRSENCSELFKDETIPLNSGKYFIKHQGMIYECRVTNFPYDENGVYVFQTCGNDVFFEFIKCKIIRDIIENNSGSIREAVTGINLSNNVIREKLKKLHLNDDEKYADITAANCYKLLRLNMHIAELMRYTEGSLECTKIDLSAFLERFTDESADILNGKIEIKSEIEKGLVVNVNAERLEICLMCLVIMANEGNAENNIINISAKHIGEYVSIAVSTDSCGIDSARRTCSKHVDIHTGDETNMNLFIINRFCKTFGGTLFITDEKGKPRIFNIKLPFCSDISVKTPISAYKIDNFSKYQVMYSEIIY